METYISTGAFKSKNIEEILSVAKKNNIKNLEISPGLDFCKNIKEMLTKNKEDFSFLIHNYFPTPKEAFALNLASTSDDIVDKSMKMCKEAIDFCALMDVPFYSVHCGFCFDTDGTAFGNKLQTKVPRFSYVAAKERFVNSIKELCQYAANRGINIAIENNVVAEFAKEDKDLFLGVDDTELLELLDLVNEKNLGVLLDLAHAHVSAHNVGFDMYEMISKLKSHIMEIHISENDGHIDQNLPVYENGIMMDYLKLCPDAPVTLEVYNIEPEEIIEQLEMINRLKREL